LFGGAGDDKDAAFQAEMAVEQAWRGADVLGRRKLGAIYSLTCGLVIACVHAKKELAHNARPWEGRAWETMICELASFAARRGLSIRVRKDTDKLAGAMHSPFVVFVKAIQDQFPPEVPIRFSTENSLATQISGVLARAREHGIDFRQEPEKQIPPAG
jgi:hypothetical protein